MAYEDAPWNGATLVDKLGQQYDTSISGTTAGPDLNGGVKIAPGESALGYLTFEVPKTAKFGTFQFTLDSGFADGTAEWKIG